MFRRVLAVLLIVPMSTSGCSFLFTDTVPDNPTQLKYFDCTSTPGLAVADGVSAVSNGVSGVVTLTTSEEEFESENDGASRNLVAGVTLGIAAIMVASGIYGLVHSERCRRAKHELETRLLAPEVHKSPIQPKPVVPAQPSAAGAAAPQPAAATSEAAPGQGASTPGEIKMLEIPEQPAAQ
ncbi:MAG TPA: hypothetical protein VJR89_02690 [Polyangiales bacterium]|nr:hypothetical protein [Polyangiales bacterium]